MVLQGARSCGCSRLVHMDHTLLRRGYLSCTCYFALTLQLGLIPHCCTAAGRLATKPYAFRPYLSRV